MAVAIALLLGISAALQKTALRASRQSGFVQNLNLICQDVVI